ncbi:MAG: hypothetical protein JWM12_3129, partial [Ilumatobacteraceae bacterium]|nr:hypothetical protein [Ilumatobacteraceae bacterium]
DGAKDAYVVEGGQMVQYKVNDRSQLGTLVKSGDLIDVEGQLGTYKTIKNAIGAAPATVAPPTT